jgi:hypothetical protein
MFSLLVELSDKKGKCHSAHTAHGQYLLRRTLILSTHSKIRLLRSHFCVTELQIFRENILYLHSLASVVEERVTPHSYVFYQRSSYVYSGHTGVIVQEIMEINC